MDSTSWAVTVATVAFGVFVSIALGVLGVSRAHHPIARLACWGAAGSLWVLVLVFGVTVALSPAARNAIVFIACGLVGLALLRSIRWVSSAGDAGSLDFQVSVACAPYLINRIPVRTKDTQLVQIGGPPRTGHESLGPLVSNTLVLGGMESGELLPEWPISICKVTNFSRTLLSGIKLTFQIEWAQSYQPGIGSRGILGKSPFTLLSLQFSPEDQSDTFYVFSVSTSHVIVTLPQEADVRPVGSDDYQKVKLVRRNEPRDEGFVLNPNPNVKAP